MSSRASLDLAASDCRNAARAQLLDAIQTIRTTRGKPKCVLVMDEPSVSIVSELVHTSELMKLGVVLLEQYNLARQPIPSYHAIYVLDPQTDLAQVVKDFSGKASYGACHLLFTYLDQDRVVARLRDEANLLKYVATLKFLFLQYSAFDPFVFQTRTEDAFKVLYSPRDNPDTTKVHGSLVKGLVSFCMNMKLRPHVAFSKNPDHIGLLVSKFEVGMAAAIDKLPESSRAPFDRDKSLMIVIGRGDDMMSPMIHQFSYEAQCHDVLDVVDGRVACNPAKPENITRLRWYEDKEYQQIRYLQDNLSNILMAFISPLQEIERRMHHGETPEIKREAVKEMSTKKEELDSARAHMDTAEVAVGIGATRGHMNLAILENDIASGRKDGEKYDPGDRDVAKRLFDCKGTVSDQMRVLAVLNAKKGKSDAKAFDRVSESLSGCDAWKPFVLNVGLIASGFKRKEYFSSEHQWSHDKYIPLVHELAKNAYTSKLDAKGSLALPSSLSGRPNTIIVFVVGGLSYMEMRWLDSLRQSMKGVKLYVGSSHFLEGNKFMMEVGSLGRA